jgi:hypothetical protein
MSEESHTGLHAASVQLFPLHFKAASVEVSRQFHETLASSCLSAPFKAQG